MATTEVLNSFLANLVRMVYPNPLTAIAAEVRRGILGNRSTAYESEHLEVVFNVHWHLSDYFEQEFATQVGGEPGLQSVLVLSRKPDSCHACTCRDYMRMYWPRTCGDVFQAIGWEGEVPGRE